MQYCTSPAGNKSPVKVASFIFITIYLNVGAPATAGESPCVRGHEAAAWARPRPGWECVSSSSCFVILAWQHNTPTSKKRPFLSVWRALKMTVNFSSDYWDNNILRSSGGRCNRGERLLGMVMNLGLQTREDIPKSKTNRVQCDHPPWPSAKSLEKLLLW